MKKYKLENTRVLRPINYIASFILGIGSLGIVMHFLSVDDIEYNYVFQVFNLIMSSTHICIAIGIFYRKHWGLLLLKMYLRLLYCAIPIGTYIGIKFMKYLNDNEIEKFFKSTQ